VKAEIARSYAEGSPVNELANRYGVDRTKICAALDAASMSRPPQRMTEQEVAQAVELYGQGHSLDAVAGLLGRATQTVQKALLAAGVAIRDTRGRPRS